MSFLATTPQEDLAAAGEEIAAKSKQALIWFAVIAVIVLVIMFSGKRT